jgi:hypothetical protein
MAGRKHGKQAVNSENDQGSQRISKLVDETTRRRGNVASVAPNKENVAGMLTEQVIPHRGRA